MMKKNWIRIAAVLAALLGMLLLASCHASPSQPNGSAQESETPTLSDLDRFYTNPATEGYADLRTLDADYSGEQAQADQCFVIGAMVHNDNLYTEFMERYQNHEDAFIRVAQDTVEGDLYLYDVLYDSEAEQVYVVTDMTRDGFSAPEDRVIAFHAYDETAEYELDGHLYWIAYRGALEDVTLDGEDVFVLAFIN